MTVSTSYTLDYTTDQILRMAYQSCGLLEAGRDPNANDLAMGRDFLNLELMALEAEGPITRRVTRTTLSLVAGTSEYTLPADTLDVKLGPNDELGTIVPTSGGETIVFNMPLADYTSISVKTAQGRPTRAYVERGANIKIILWPVPDSTAASLRYNQVRLGFDSSTGLVTVDLARRWLKALVLLTSAQIARAKSLPLQLYGSLRGEGESLKERLLADDMQRGNMYAVVKHNVNRWS